MSSRTTEFTVQVRQLFDAKAAAWPSKYTPDGRLVGRLTRLACAVTYHVPAGGNVLDLGCGTGELSGAIAAAGMRATGCDISPEMLRRAATADPAGVVDWVQLDPGWRVLPFAPGIYDAVVASSVLEYVDDPVAVLGECARVIRPGGVVLCTVPNLRHPVRWLEWLAGLTARLPLLGAATRRWLRLDRYLTYLRVSRQRRSAKWWCAAGARVGLLTAPRPTYATDFSPLRLLILQRPNETRNGS